MFVGTQCIIHCRRWLYGVML